MDYFINKFIEILVAMNLAHSFYINIYEIIETRSGVKNGNFNSYFLIT